MRLGFAPGLSERVERNEVSVSLSVLKKKNEEAKGLNFNRRV